jgi:hypothetical protein
MCTVLVFDVQLAATHAVAESNQWPRHLVTEVIDQVKQVPWMIVPRRYSSMYQSRSHKNTIDVTSYDHPPVCSH